MKKVVGGGLGGLASAISLVANGEEVELVERFKEIGLKFPESVHGFRNYSTDMDEIEYIKSRGFSLDSLKPIHKIIKLGPSLNPSETYSKDKPMFYAVKRGNAKESIDLQLFKQAENVGVKFKLGETGSVSDADIIATGASFMKGVGYGHHYKDANVDEDVIIFLLDNAYAPKGYACAIPYGKSEVSIMVTSFDLSSFNHMPSLFKNLVENIPTFSKLVEGATAGQPFAKIGFYHIPESAKINNRLIVGEAAGFVEADRGFGMHYALESGFLAAKAMTDGTDYDVLWKKSFQAQLLKAFKRRLVLDRLENKHYDQLINAGTKMSVEEYVKYKKAQNVSLVKELLLHLHTINEVKKLRSKFNIKQFYSQ